MKIGHHANAIAFAKWSVWVKNEKCQKHPKNHSTRTLELFCAKAVVHGNAIAFPNIAFAKL